MTVLWLYLKRSKYTKYSIAFQAPSDEKSTRQCAHVDRISASIRWIFVVSGARLGDTQSHAQKHFRTERGGPI